MDKIELRKELHALGVKTYKNKITGKSFIKKSELKKVLADDESFTSQSLDREYNYLPEEFKENLQVGKRVYIHFHRNLDMALDKPSYGKTATVKEIYKSGFKVKLPAHFVNNNMIKYDMKRKETVVKIADKDRYVFVTIPKLKGKALNGYVAHIDTKKVNSGEVIIGSMSSSLMD